MKNASLARKAIAKFYPDLEIKSLSVIGEGMDSVAFLINESLIFRFPKSSDIRENLRKEIFVLPRLRSRLAVEIPDFTYIAEDLSFVGYRKLAGEFLTKEIFESMPKATQDDIQMSLAEFLIAVHQTDISDFSACGIEPQNLAKDYAEDLENSRRYAFSLLTAKEQKYVTLRFEAYLSDEDNFLEKPVLLHNDLSSDHILINQKTKKLTGIIDFGDVGIGDADYDLMYFLDDYGEEFVRSFLKCYPHPDHKRLFAKLYFWNLADILQLINNYTENEESDEIERLTGILKDWIRLMRSKGY